MGKKEDKEDFEVKLKWKHLERIAAYYEFPVTVFFAETLPMKGMVGIRGDKKCL